MADHPLKEPPPQRRKQADRRAEAEDRLVAAAIELIAKRGVDGLRLAELGAIAGYSRALPAHYFGHKENLIQAIIRRIIDQHYRNARELPSDAPGLGRVTSLVEAYVRAMRARRSNIVALHAIYAAAATNPDVQPIVLSLNEESTLAVKAGLDAAIGLGEVGSGADTRLEATSLLAFLRGVGSLHLVDPETPIERMTTDYLTSMRRRLSEARDVA